MPAYLIDLRPLPFYVHQHGESHGPITAPRIKSVMVFLGGKWEEVLQKSIVNGDS